MFAKEKNKTTQCYSLFSGRRSWISWNAFDEWSQCTENMRCHWLVCWMETCTSVREYREVSTAVLECLLYGPKLSPHDFPIFGPLKKALRGRRFYSGSEVICNGRNWLRFKPNNVCKRDIHRLLKQGDNCNWVVLEIMFELKYMSFHYVAPVLFSFEPF